MTNAQNTQSAPAAVKNTDTCHVTLVLKHRWTAQISTLDLPDYIPGTDTGVTGEHTVIDIVNW